MSAANMFLVLPDHSIIINLNLKKITEFYCQFPLLDLFCDLISFFLFTLNGRIRSLSGFSENVKCVIWFYIKYFYMALL